MYIDTCVHIYIHIYLCIFNERASVPVLFTSDRRHLARHLPRGWHCVNIEQTPPSRRSALWHRGVPGLSAGPLEFLGRQEFLSCTPLVTAPRAVVSRSQRLRARPGNHCLCCSLLTQVDLRRQWVSKTVEELQTVIYRLTTDVSNQDVRFQAVPYSLAYNGNFKVSRSHLSLGAHPESPETGVGGASVCRALRPLRIRLTLPISVGTLSIYHPHTQRLAIISFEPHIPVFQMIEVEA